MRGRLRPRIPPKAKDWDHVLETTLKTGFSHEEVAQMTRSQRTKAQETAARAPECPNPRAERICIWNAWQLAPPPKIHDWREHLASIDRLDLYRDLDINSPLYGSTKNGKGEKHVFSFAGQPQIINKNKSV